MHTYQHTKTGMVLCTQPTRSFYSNELRELLSDPKRTRDINGPKVGEIMSRTGWMFQTTPILSTACEEGSTQHASAGWAAGIQWFDGSPGVNLSYATHPKSEGLGLGRLCCAMSFLQLCEETSPQELGNVNIQCRSDNIGSQKIAIGMGLNLNPGASFWVPAIGAKFLAFTTPAEKFREVCSELLEQHCTVVQTHTQAVQPRWRS